MTGKRIFLSGILAVTFGFGSAATAAAPEEILIGNTAPYSGPASVYSTIAKAIDAYFTKVNDEGGINGRKIKFHSLDDSYSPPKTKEQFRKLVEKEKVLLIFQSLGTAPNSAVRRYMNKKKVPQLFVATGAAKWNDPSNFPWTMGWQPNYEVESELYARWILKNRPKAKIGILSQNDDFGRDFLKGLRKGLGDRYDKMVVGTETFEPTDPTIDSQVIKLKAAGADLFLNVATPRTASQAIKKIYDLQWKPTHIIANVSSSIASVLKPAGFEKSQGLISTRYFLDPNSPTDEKTKGIKDWKAFMAKYYPKGDTSNAFNVYGYLVAQTMVHVLEKCGNDLSRENIMKQAANIKGLALDALIPGITINTSPTDYSPVESMELIEFKGENWVPGEGGVIRSGNDVNLPAAAH